MDLATTDEAAGMEALYQIAPHDALLVAVADNAFWKFRDYELYHYAIVTDPVVTNDVPAILARMRQNPTRPAFLVLTRPQRAALELQYGLADSTWQGLSSGLLADPAVRVVFIDPDVRDLPDDSQGCVVTGRLVAPVAMLVAAGATELVVFAGGHGAIRVALAMAFLLFAPGIAVLRLMELEVDIVPASGLAVGSARASTWPSPPPFCTRVSGLRSWR